MKVRAGARKKKLIANGCDCWGRNRIKRMYGVERGMHPVVTEKGRPRIGTLKRKFVEEIPEKSGPDEKHFTQVKGGEEDLLLGGRGAAAQAGKLKINSQVVTGLARYWWRNEDARKLKEKGKPKGEEKRGKKMLIINIYSGDGSQLRKGEEIISQVKNKKNYSSEGGGK